MKRKYIIFFMHFFTSICLVSVGFASWTFVSGDSITASGNIVAQDVITNSEIVYIENAENLSLRYYKTGFLDSDNNVVAEGIMSITYVINLDKYKEIYPNYASLSVVTHLNCISSNSYNIFNSSSNYISSSHTIVDSNSATVATTAAGVVNNCDYQINFELNDILLTEDSTYSFTIDYIFTISNHQNFYKYIYPYMSGLTFSPSIMLNGE